jgi:uncharacterized sporulation protein YeaH/YhbH (DUF444 family)
VYLLGLNILDQRYPESRYNRYAFHFTDGGNLTSDNATALQLGRELARQTTLFGYGEIHDTDRNPSPLYQAFHEEESTGVVLLRTKEDIVWALDYYFGRKEAADADSYNA